MTPYQIKKTAGEFGISIESAIRMRVRYLVALVDRWTAFVCEEDPDFNEMPESTLMDAIFEIDELRRYEKRCRKPVKEDITDDMIQAARDFPVEQLVEFTKGIAVAFCHPDNRPSLSWDRKRNRAHCFPCGKDFNAIDILVERDGYSFKDAVKFLAR